MSMNRGEQFKKEIKYKVFATALGVHYPKKLREAIANAFALKFAQEG